MKKMDRTLKGTVAVVLSALVLAVAVYGSYLPMRKAQIFIGTLRSFQVPGGQPSSLQDLETRLAAGLDAPSPIGQEELVRNTANSTMSLVQRGLDEPSVTELLRFLDIYYAPILERGKGMSFGQDIYLAGAINEIAFAQTGKMDFLEASRKYYEKGVALAPDRPQVLYGLFDVYRALGDATNTELIANRIMTNWPADAARIQAGLADFRNRTKAKGK